jgi:hypothetical protein
LTLALNFLPFRFGTYFINKFEVHLKFILFSGDDDNKKLPSFEGS